MPGRIAPSSEALAGEDEHVVVFYSDDRELIEPAGKFLLDGVRNGVAIVFATPGHRLALDAWLGCAGVDVARVARSRKYVELDAADTLAKFMIRGWPDPAAFWQIINPLIEEAASSGGPVRIFGEMVWLLWESGQVGAAVDVEALWNEMGAKHSFGLLCGYAADSAFRAEHRDAFTVVCSAHTRSAGVQFLGPHSEN